MKKSKIEFYRDSKREWRWRFKSSNGRVICASTEGYKRFAGAEKSFNVFVESLDTMSLTITKEGVDMGKL